MTYTTSRIVVVAMWAAAATFAGAFAIANWPSPNRVEEEKLNLVEEAISCLEKALAGVPKGETGAAVQKLLNGYSLDCDFIFETLDGIDGDLDVKTRRKNLVERNNTISEALEAWEK
jgi:hypothetical protein